MAGSITRKHLNSNFELSGVFASAALFLTDLNKLAAEEGMLYFDTTLNQLRTFDGSSWSPAGQNGVSAGSLDDAANIGVKITIDAAFSTGIEIEATDAIISSNGQLLLLDNNDTGSDIHALEITSTSTAPAIQITNSTATTDDIQGTSDSWAVTGQGAAELTALTFGDSEPINFGASTDSVLQWDSARLALTAAADSVFRIGAAGFSYDVEFIGQTAVTNLMKWDLDGGADSLGALIFDNADIDMGQNDLIRFGDSQEFTLSHDGTQLILAGDDQIFHLGVAGAGFDMFWYTENTGDHVFFDEDNALVDFIDVNIDLDDDALVRWGTGNDITTQFNGTKFLMLAGTDDLELEIGNGTNSFDIQVFGETSAADIVFDASENKLSLDGIDLKLEDNDYILLGDSATAGSSTDGTIRWDATNSVVEIIGNTTFEGATIIIDNDLTVSGTLTLSGAIAPGSIAMGDGEALTFGDGNDLTISATGTTATIAILSGSLLAITGSGGNELTIGASGNLVNLTLSGTLDLGADGKGYDVSFFAENSSDLVLWDQNAVTNVGAFIFTGSCAYFTDSSGVGDTAILLGGGASNNGDFSIRGTSGPALLINQVASGVGTMEIGVSGKGITTTFHSETASAFMKWNQATDQLQLEGASGTASLALGDGDKILLGDTLGTGDFVISSTSNVLTLDQVTTGDQSTIIIGADDDGMDITIHGDTASSQVKWTTASDSLIFTDAPIVFDGNAVDYTFTTSTDAMLVTATDGSAAKVTWGDNGTNGLDQEWLSVSAGNLLNWDAGTETLKFTDILCTMIGADSRGTILAITGNDTSGNSDTMTINHDGTAAGLKITCDGTTSVALELTSAASQTTTLALLDGTTGNWIGANDVGMLQLTKDTALANAGGSMLLVTNSAQPVSAAEGFMARFVDTGTAQTNAFGVQISVTSTTGALNVASGTSTFADAVTCTTGVQSSAVTLEAQVEANQQTITAGVAFVTVTIANDANDVIILPTAVIGNVIRITVPATGCELQTAVAGSDQINGVDCSGANEMAMAAGSTYTLTCAVANKWQATGVSTAGAAQATIVPDADS